MQKLASTFAIGLVVGCATQPPPEVDDSSADGKDDSFSRLSTRSYLPNGDDFLSNPPHYFGFLVLKTDHTFVRSNFNLPGQTNGPATGTYELTTAGATKHVRFETTAGALIDDWEYSISDYTVTMKTGSTTFGLDPSITGTCRVADDCALQTLPACSVPVTCSGTSTTKTCGCADTQTNVIKDAKTAIGKYVTGSAGFPASAKTAVASLPSTAKLQYHLYHRDGDPTVYTTSAYKLVIDQKTIFAVETTDNDTLVQIDLFDAAGWELAYGEQTEEKPFQWIVN
jgi:hypothetical protein